MFRKNSNRLKDFDYANNGGYFITICTQNRENMFGEIVDKKMVLNDVGKMVDKWWQELRNKFGDIRLDEFVIMPNHLHGIITIVGADLRVCPNKKGEHIGSPLQKIMQWFKTMTTNEYFRNVKNKGWQTVDKKIWQRGYYDHIVRNEKELSNIRNYIQNNPLKWHLDIENRINNKKIELLEYYNNIYEKKS